MQAVITQEEWEEYQWLKRESITEDKAIDDRVADEMERVAMAFKSGIESGAFYTADDVYESIKTAASIVRAHLNATHLHIHHK